MEAHEAPPPAAAAAPLQQAPNLPPPRLIISEMVLENFKSYAGEQRVGPFHKVGLKIGCFRREREREKTVSPLGEGKCGQKTRCFRCICCSRW